MPRQKRQPTTVEAAIVDMRRKISSRALSPGSRLPEEDLAQAYDLPRAKARGIPNFHIFGEVYIDGKTWTARSQSGAHLLESKLSVDQTVQELADGRLRFTATVPHTERLIWWLLSFGPYVKVEKPLTLRREVASRLREGAAQYGDVAGDDADTGPATQP